MSPLRMRDLCEQSGLNRQAIHFYITQGLLPPGAKRGRNQAVYTEAHLERLRWIRRLQHERFLPLSAIRALLTADEAGLSGAQREFLRELREELPLPGAPGGAGAWVDAEALVQEGGIGRADLERAGELGLLALEQTKGGGFRLPARQEELARTLGALRAAGLSAELGFTVEDLLPFVEAVRRLVGLEVALVASRLGQLPRAQAGEVVRAALPALQRLLVQLHETCVYDRLDAV